MQLYKHVIYEAHTPVLIDGQQLREVKEQKYLGILFDSKLQYEMCQYSRNTV